MTGNPLGPLGEGEPSGVVRVTEMLRRLNSQAEAARRGSDSEEERTSRSVSRRSSGGDSGLGNLSESEILDQENTERTEFGLERIEDGF